jgi:hypothetical protein
VSFDVIIVRRPALGRSRRSALGTTLCAPLGTT